MRWRRGPLWGLLIVEVRCRGTEGVSTTFDRGVDDQGASEQLPKNEDSTRLRSRRHTLRKTIALQIEAEEEPSEHPNGSPHLAIHVNPIAPIPHPREFGSSHGGSHGGHGHGVSGSPSVHYLPPPVSRVARMRCPRMPKEIRPNCIALPGDVSWPPPEERDMWTGISVVFGYMPYLVILVSCLNLLKQRGTREASFIAFAAVIVGINEFLLKKIGNQERPELSCLTTQGMPSSHAAMAIGFLTLLFIDGVTRVQTKYAGLPHEWFHFSLRNGGDVVMRREERLDKQLEKFESKLEKSETEESVELRALVREQRKFLRPCETRRGSHLWDIVRRQMSYPTGDLGRTSCLSHLRLTPLVGWDVIPHQHFVKLALLWAMIMLPVPVSRVFLEDHTLAQVSVGASFGCLSAILWAYMMHHVQVRYNHLLGHSFIKLLTHNYALPRFEVRQRAKCLILAVARASDAEEDTSRFEEELDHCEMEIRWYLTQTHLQVRRVGRSDEAAMQYFKEEEEQFEILLSILKCLRSGGLEGIRAALVSEASLGRRIRSF